MSHSAREIRRKSMGRLWPSGRSRPSHQQILTQHLGRKVDFGDLHSENRPNGSNPSLES